MPKNPDQAAINSNPNLQDALRRGGVTDPVDDPNADQPLYRVMADSKIPVAKSYGQLWKSRIDQSTTARKDAEEAWKEAIRYYENDQIANRSGRDNYGGQSRATRTLGSQWAETENVVFSNAVTLLPMLYAKNPSVEVTAHNEANLDYGEVIKHVVNALLTMKEAPGLNLKSKARRGVLSALLTNNAYLKLGWVQKDDSSQAAMAELQDLSKELTDAKNAKDVRVAEGKINSLTDKIALLEPSGPTAKLVSPFRVLVDPTAQEPDHSDANWIAEWDYLPTNYLRAMYGKPGTGDSIVSTYEPTHVLMAGDQSDNDEDKGKDFKLFDTSNTGDMKNYGYRDKAAYEAAQYTQVWWIWDKTTRRVFLYANNKWDWPLWVWDDPLKLLRFYPYYRLWFHETPEGAQPKGEVTYYLDQQDAINEVNAEISLARKWAKRNIFYDKNKTNQEDVEQILKGPDGTARGIDVPEGMKIGDLLFSVVPPAIAHPDLFSNDKRFETINRITGISEAVRGGQFKTNTTNQAVQAYQSNTDIRVDEKVDAIEDWIGDVAWGLAQLCVQYWTIQDVTDLVGQQDAANWQTTTDVASLRMKFSMSLVGGSMDKPTSKNKKQQALQIGQVLGQIGNSVPAAGLVMLKVFERAFDEVVISDKDWEQLIKSMEDQSNAAGAGPQGQGAPGQPQPGQAKPVDPQQVALMKDQLSKLPPDLLAHMKQLIERGVSPTDALKEVTKATPAPSIQLAKQSPPPQMHHIAPGPHSTTPPQP